MWSIEKTESGNDIVFSGIENGIAPSPNKGTANIQNANISTESGEVLASYNRTAQQPAAQTSQSLTPNGSTDFTGPSTLKAGVWINVASSTVTSISATTTPTTASADYLVVAGGGGGGYSESPGTNLDACAGGGGGGEVEASTASFSVTSYAVTIGTGGAGGTSTSKRGTSGGNTTIGSLVTALGGGGGGSSIAATDDGSNGGNGGGGGGDANAVTSGTGGTGSPGFNGGNGSTASGGGGGGGAGAAGTAGSSGGGNGGIGVPSSITGTDTYYGGGGGGGAAGGVSPNSGNGGQGGGGDGGKTTGGSVETNPENGQANTGGGGGGGGSTDNLTMDGGTGGSGIAVISYTTGTMVAVGGTVTYNGTKTIHTFTSDGTFTVLFIPKANQYYVSYKSGTTFRLSSKFDPTGANALTHGTTGTVTFSTVAVPNKGVAKAVEKYTNATTTEYRYYVLDANSNVWVFDSSIYETYGTMWMQPDPGDYSSLKLTGIGALNGLLMAVGKAFVVGKLTNNLGRIFNVLDGAYLNEPFPTHTNQALVGSQGKMYYCDGNYIGEVFPTTSLVTSIANIQSQCQYTASSTTGTISLIANGSLPYSPDGTRIPAIFYTDVYGTQPTNLVYGNLYYIQYDPLAATFKVYSAITGGSAINIATGAAGNQFFTTFYPFGPGGANGSTPLVQISTQRVNLPANETAQTMCEIGNTVLIGGKTNIVYPWNQIDATPTDFINLPESDVKVIVNANNTAYIFAGNKGNVYVSNGGVAALALKVPDYCAGIHGTPLTYIEPVFEWGDADYLRGRVYFSILDQTSTKAGNCGGIWSFVPVQNMDPSQDIGVALRLENQQSYGDYDGVANLIIPNLEQNVTSPQYWAVWQDSYSTGTSNFGIDYTGTVPVTTYIVETDLLNLGTFLDKQTLEQVEYVLSTPLATGDSVQLYYRENSTDTWATCGTVIEETADKISGYFQPNFEKSQRLQFRVVVTTAGTTASSFVRLMQLRVR